jgi:clan AA aspartic protease
MEITGSFDEGNPIIQIYLDVSEDPIDVLVDTGFNGELMLKKKKIEELSLPSIGDDEYMTASGDIVPTTIHIGFIKWFGRTRKIAVLATTGKAKLIGLELLHFYRLELARSQNRLVISES